MEMTQRAKAAIVDSFEPIPLPRKLNIIILLLLISAFGPD